jgi:hypothetical protein
MKSRSAPGSSTPTSRLTDRLPRPLVVLLIVLLTPIATLYVILAFTAESPILRIVLRCLPVLPAVVWTLWFDASRPVDHRPAALQLAVRVTLLVIAMAIAVALLGLGLNWIYDPSRVV